MARIIVVDDSGYARRVHRRILEDAGHQVVEAGSGAAALEACFLEKPDLVLLDLSMGDISGLEVLSHLRELDPHVRAIVVSADVQRSTEALVRAAGAARFLGKPASPDTLLEAVDAVLDEVPQ